MRIAFWRRRRHPALDKPNKRRPLWTPRDTRRERAEIAAAFEEKTGLAWGPDGVVVEGTKSEVFGSGDGYKIITE